MNTKKSLAFIVELLGLFILLILVIVIVTQVFVMSRSWSLRAEQLTQAVILAENTAEVASASPTLTALSDNLSGTVNAAGSEGRILVNDESGAGRVYLTEKFNDNDKSGGTFIIRVTRSLPEGGTVDNPGNGIYAEDLIEIFPHDGPADDIYITEDTEPLYALTAGTFFDDDEIRKEARP
ncbi:MAG: hypothetical protein IKE85_04600 [Mogibacterium sp.]|nr:hypothetical protein [Mogibacterium sp.]